MSTVIRTHTSARTGALLFESVHLADCPDLAAARGASGVAVREYRYDCGPLEALRRHPRLAPGRTDVACTCVREAAWSEAHAEHAVPA